MSDKLTLKLLGKPQILLNDEPVMIFHKAQALFYYLAVTGHAHERSALLELLWGKIEGSDAKNNLRVTLSHLRKQKLGDFLAINRHSVAFNYGSNYTLDVESLKNALRATPKTADYLEKTLQLYRGPFLEGFQVPEEKVFEQWVKQERQHVHNLVVQTLYNLALRYQEQRNYTASIDAINRLLRLEPYHEDAQQMMMVLFNKTGQQSEAIAQYNLYTQQLKERREVVPSLQEILENRNKALQTPRMEDLDTPEEIEAKTVVRHSERRQVTLLYCHIQDKQPELDPEAWYTRRQAMQSFIAKQVSMLRATPVQQDDYGALLVFGCPQEYEGSSFWAVQAGLTIQQNFAQTEFAETTQLSIGVHTGFAIVDIARSETKVDVDVIGPPRDLAQQLARHATPEGIYISPETYEIVKGYFLTKTVDKPSYSKTNSTIYQVLGETGVQNHLEASCALQRKALTPLVNRQLELETLWVNWQAAQEDSMARFVFIHGEMGVGKSRIVHALTERVISEYDRSNKPMMLKAQCMTFYQNQPLRPLMLMLQNLWACHSQTILAGSIGELASTEESERAAGLNWLIQQLNGDEVAEPSDMENLQEQIVQGALALLQHLAQTCPVLLVIEDLQWADNATISLLSLLLEQQEYGTQLLTLVTARPEFRPSWPHYSHTTSLQLARLSNKDTASLMGSIIDDSDVEVDEETRQKLLEHSDGIPLFAEALARHTVQTQDIDAVMVNLFPPVLYSALMMPLDELKAAKKVAQFGAVLGREFRYDTLVRLWDSDEKSLQTGLELLVKTGIVYPRGQIPQASYKFNYSLMQQAAYHSLLQKNLQNINIEN
ncbi:AAA family ATPase [Candidatus Albibeggiatoa sp. nov. BB20]|uniref:AAA family ATPase n=1 Tax=Candidatus Albibeggiatoa sp. nov. BB20 TaxID=3162723 RepID=UPI0033659051